jgi:hypothetical protein
MNLTMRQLCCADVFLKALRRVAGLVIMMNHDST